ncbi:MAG: efflux RND transporter periplasmic adaptor subunit [Hyphomicrobiaceae bacterium]
MTLRSIFSALGIGTTLLTIAMLSGCGDADERPQAEVVRSVRVVQITDASNLAKRWFPGRAKATQEVTLAFRVSGTLVARSVNVGDEVDTGKIVAQLDREPFERKVERLSAELDKAKARFENASAQTQRQVTLLEKGWVAQAKVDTFIAHQQSAKAEVESVTATLRRAELDLDYTSLKSPFAGRIVATYVENFEEVKATQPVVRLLDTSRIEMVIDVPENLISLAPYAQDIAVTYDAFPDLKIPATVNEVGTEANETTRTYPVTLIMDQPSGERILPGMAGKATGRAVVPGKTAEAQIAIPMSSVFTTSDGAGSFVWIVDRETMTVSPRAVVLGSPIAQGLVATEGLSAGDLVVSAGVHSLREGQKVKLLEQRRS